MTAPLDEHNADAATLFRAHRDGRWAQAFPDLLKRDGPPPDAKSGAVGAAVTEIALSEWGRGRRRKALSTLDKAVRRLVKQSRHGNDAARHYADWLLDLAATLRAVHERRPIEPSFDDRAKLSFAFGYVIGAAELCRSHGLAEVSRETLVDLAHAALRARREPISKTDIRRAIDTQTQGAPLRTWLVGGKP